MPQDQPLQAAGAYDGETFTASLDIKTVPIALNRGEVCFTCQLHALLREHVVLPEDSLAGVLYAVM